MISQEIINRMGVMRRTSTFLNGNGKNSERRQDRRCRGGCHREMSQLKAPCQYTSYEHKSAMVEVE